MLCSLTVGFCLLMYGFFCIGCYIQAFPSLFLFHLRHNRHYAAPYWLVFSSALHISYISSGYLCVSKSSVYGWYSREYWATLTFEHFGLLFIMHCFLFCSWSNKFTHMYTHVCMKSYTCTHTHTHTHTQTHTHTLKHTQLHIHVHVHRCTYTHVKH